MADELQHIVESEAAIPLALRWAQSNLPAFLYGGEAAIFVGRPRRTADQNDKMWPMLRDLSRQVVWYGQKLTEHEWKDVMTAALKKQRAVPGIDGGFVVLGAHTSKLSKSDMADLIEIIYAFGGEQGVAWSEPAKKAYAESKRAA